MIHQSKFTFMRSLALCKSSLLTLLSHSSATNTSCEDAYHIWTFCIMNEFVGLAVAIPNGTTITIFEVS